MPENGNAYTIDEITQIVNGRLIYSYRNPGGIDELLLDSRRLTTPSNTVFFAITSQRNDGHKFIPDLYEKGVRNFIVSKYSDDWFKGGGANVIVVDDPQKALQILGKHHRGRFHIPVLGISGSNGKTIVKEWLSQLLSGSYNLVKNPKSYNSQIGVPLSVWLMNNKHELALFEAGISEPDEMQNLERIIQPAIGLITNIGLAHDENFVSKEEKLNEKLKLFNDAETIIYCSDHKLIDDTITSDINLKSKELFTWGTGKNANVIINKASRQIAQTQIEYSFNGKQHTLTIPFTDDASFENAMHCLTASLFLGAEPQTLKSGFSKLTQVAMRLELKEGINNSSIINDSYSSDIKSLNIALDFLDQQKKHDKKTVILSDILQSGRKDEELYQEVAQLLVNKKISRVIGIGENISKHSDMFPIQKHFYPDTESFLTGFSFRSFQNEAILLKGARVFHFEKISNLLQQKAHETKLEIDLDALIHNFNYYKSLLKPDTKMMVMVKAFSYGSGSTEIAQVLQYHHADYLAVAYIDEGLELRKAGIHIPIMVMNPDEQGMESLIRYRLEPEIYNFRVLEMLEQAIESYFGNSMNEVNVHIKLDTGMHRLGFEENDFDILLQKINSNPRIKIKSVFSHLSGSETPEMDVFSRNQINRFLKMTQSIEESVKSRFDRHILNSAGISRFPEAHFNMVRLGIGLYGIGVDTDEQKKLQYISSLKTRISQIKNVIAGDSVGYGGQWKSDREMKVAVVPIGYADGLSRFLGNGRGSLWVNGKRAPIIGNVCMDMSIIDITDINAEEGDEVIVFGNEYPITEIAHDLNTIPYEVLTSISRRVKRVYYQEQ